MEILNETTIPDEDIVREYVLTRKDNLFSDLYQRYFPKILNKCRSFTKNKETAQDLSHDILIKVLLNLDSFNHRSKFSTWLYAMVNNYCIDQYRRNKAIRLTDLENALDSSDDLSDTEYKEEFELKFNKIIDILDLLPEEDRNILIAKYHDNLSICMLQKKYGISESGIKMKLKRARDKAISLYFYQTTGKRSQKKKPLVPSKTKLA